MPFTWTFEQIEGVGERKKLTLDGYNAPFGRPRQGPVIEEVIKSRIQTTFIPGLDDAPIRSAFGASWEPTELKGRWMTKNLAAQGSTANIFADEWARFVRDQRTVRMSWGAIVSYTAFIEELRLGRESQHEIAWKMKVHIDRRDDIERRRTASTTRPIADDLSDLDKFLKGSSLQKAPEVPDMTTDVFEILDNFAAKANEFSSVMNKLAGRFDDMEKATFSTIQHFRGAGVGLQTAIISARDTLTSTAIDSVLAVRSAVNDTLWVTYLNTFDTDSCVILDMLAGIDRKVELKAQSEASKLITAVEGDSWESLATRAYGDPAKAGTLRSANGARYGERPEPSETYLVP